MDSFSEVTVVKKANVYFGGGVTSRTVLFPDGSRKTLGIMMPGEYLFDTSKKEIIEILAGKLDVLLPDASEWKSFTAGDSFEVPARKDFQLKVHELTDYCCSYLD